MSRRKKLLYLVTEDWYFCSHRLPLAVAAHDAGHEVLVVTQVSKHAERIRSSGLRLIPIRFARSSHHPLLDIRTLCQLFWIYRGEQPDLVHHVSLKPVIYGSIVASLCRIKRVVNAMTGLGYVFTSSDRMASFLRLLITPVLRHLLNGQGCHTILQNTDDARILLDKKILDDRHLTIIRGSGVDLDIFTPVPEPPLPVVIVLVARMLGDKGVREFVEVARILKQRTNARFVLVGDTDYENPSAMRAEELQAWHKEGMIEWWGSRSDMASVYQAAHVVCLPSYREGLPKALLEAAACGRPLIATDVPGCREIVRNGDNGLLVPARNVQALADALERLIGDADMRVRMGARSRAIAEAEFGVDSVVEQTLALYDRVLSQ